MKQKKQIVMSKAAKIDDLLDEAEYLDNLRFNRKIMLDFFNVFIEIWICELIELKLNVFSS